MHDSARVLSLISRSPVTRNFEHDPRIRSCKFYIPIGDEARLLSSGENLLQFLFFMNLEMITRVSLKIFMIFGVKMLVNFALFEFLFFMDLEIIAQSIFEDIHAF